MTYTLLYIFLFNLVELTQKMKTKYWCFVQHISLPLLLSYYYCHHYYYFVLIHFRKEVPKSKKTMCCVVTLTSEKMEELIKMYHKKHWLDKKGESIPALCFISRIKVAKAGTSCKRLTFWILQQSESYCFVHNAWQYHKLGNR